MSFESEFQALRRELGWDQSMDQQIVSVERRIEKEAEFHRKVIFILAAALRYANSQGQDVLQLTYRNPSEEQEEAISVIEEWLEENRFEFRSLESRENGCLKIVIIIMLWGAC